MHVTPNMIGAYGPWAASLTGNAPGNLSFRRDDQSDVDTWRSSARGRLLELLAQPDTGGRPDVRTHAVCEYGGLHIEKLSWQLPYGPPTEALFLKPAGATGKLPGILALHDHAGKKYFGKRKITRAGDDAHPMMVAHQADYYGGVAWANQIASRGYAVLVHDAFPFASRRVMLQDVPDHLAGGLTDEAPEMCEHIQAYNQWASGHEDIMAKSLFCAGTTWPGVFLAEDQRALDVLCDRPDVDEERVGCGGLSGGGMRTVFLGGVDDRIRCAVCVGMMTTWRDYLLNKSHTHTWMVYVPLLPADLDYPEVLGLRVPLPTLVQNDIDDQLFTMPEMKRADSMLAEVYTKAAAPDRYRCTFYPGPHKFDLDMQSEAFEWFDGWLKPGSVSA
jgi:dienelactone hydrolase